MKKLNPFEIQQRLTGMIPGMQFSADATKQAMYRAGVLPAGAGERGYRTREQDRIRYLYQLMYVSTDLRQAIMDLREMDRLDGRVKEIHKRTARMATKKGVMIKPGTGNNKVLLRSWDRFYRRLNLNRREKLESDFRGFMMEGNLPMQWVPAPDSKSVVAGYRMPTETIVPQVAPNGAFKDPRVAYIQYDYTMGKEIAQFPLWQMSLVRLTPDNFDDMGSLGRPYLDATRPAWQKLRMTEEDLVIRRRTRAPQRLAHVLEGASESDIEKYRARVEGDQNDITADFYLNKKGAVSSVAGDANLDQIADVVHLLDTFYAGSPAPKGLFGYTGDLARDVLEDLKRDYFDEVDALQDTLSYVYKLGFYLDLLLQGINPDVFGDFEIEFVERKTETPNQAADRAIKYQAMGASDRTVFETAGLNYETELERKEDQAAAGNPYPAPNQIAGGNRVSITPGNGRKGESATDVSTTRSAK
ncbi:MAG: hypothetical protein OEZ10_11585 [Gammaproteobacteria bacterium]|nr:hypothetical protein [Gammaproteobacteria bacterium]